MVSIREFYQGKPLRLKNGETLTIYEILAKDNNWWDGCHDFIQWIFPTRTVSQYCLNAPILTEEDAEFLAKDPLANLLLDTANKRFIDFLKTQNMDDLNHNHLRITRMLESLTLIYQKDYAYYGTEDVLKLCIDFLPIRIRGEYKNGTLVDSYDFNNKTFVFWCKAVTSSW